MSLTGQLDESLQILISFLPNYHWLPRHVPDDFKSGRFAPAEWYDSNEY